MNEPNDEPAAPDPALSVILDTNAVRHLGRLSDEDWAEFIGACRAKELRTAWVPRAVSEIAGTNLDQRNGLSEETLGEIVRAIRRFDEMADGEVLPSEHDIIRLAFFDLAGEEAFTNARADGERREWRAVIDHAKAVDSVDLVAIEIEDDKRCVVLKDRGDPGRGIAVVPDDSFEADASINVEFWRMRTKCKRAADAQDRADEIRRFLPKFAEVAASTGAIAVPRRVVAKALKAPLRMIFNSSFGHRLAVESWYLHLRATGDKARIENNDMADIVISSYIPSAQRFVTNDRRLRALVGAILADPRTVLDSGTFVQAVVDSPTVV